MSATATAEKTTVETGKNGTKSETPAPKEQKVPKTAEELAKEKADAEAKAAAKKAEADALVQANMQASMLADDYVAKASGLEKLDAESKWRWSQELKGLLDGLASDKMRTVISKEIGIAIASGLGRDKAYSGSWVRQHAGAAAAFPSMPANRDEYRAFMAHVNGNAGPSKTGGAADADATQGDSDTDGEVREPSTPDPFRTLRNQVKKLLADGFDKHDILAAVQSELKGK